MRKTAEHSIRREGKGRARTGPSPSLAALLPAAVLALALAAQFAFGTDARRSFSPELIGVVSGLFAAVGLATVAGSPRGLKVRSPMDAVIPLVLGAVALVGAPALVMFHRYSDAPQGSEVLFLTTAAWGALLAVLGTKVWRRLPLSVGAAVLGLAGTAGVVANWERPSSFSLFIRYQTEETWMLVAGVAWAMVWLWFGRDPDRESSVRSVVAAAAGGVVGAVILALGRGVGLSDIATAASSAGMWMYGISTAIVAAAAVTLVRSVGTAPLAGTYFLPAAALTVITLVEQATTPLGPQPILLGPALAGAVTAFAACALLWVYRPRNDAAASSAQWAGDDVAGAARGIVDGGALNAAPAHPVHVRRYLPLVVAAMALVAGLAGLVLPALQVHVTGLRPDGQQLELSYIMRGYEVVGAWVAVGLAVVVLALALRGTKVRPGAAGALLAAGIAWPFVWATPLHTLTRFVPPEVQVDFGSEFASISFTTLAIPATLVALAGAGIGLALLLVGQRRPVASGTDSRGDIS